MLLTENQLDGWVRQNGRDAEGLIVELIFRLIAASCPNPNDRRFALPDSIGQQGEDVGLGSGLNLDFIAFKFRIAITA